MDKLMTVKEVAEYLKLNYMTIYRLAQKGQIPASKVGGAWRFKKEIMDEWLLRKTTPVEGTVLVVDDDARYREALKDVISGEGFPVVAVGTGEEALREIANRHFALVFLDLVLPAMSGVDTLRVIKEVNPELLVAIITGYGDDPIALEALSMGPLVLIRKPFGVQDIRKVLRFVTGAQQPRQPFSTNEGQKVGKT